MALPIDLKKLARRAIVLVDGLHAWIKCLSCLRVDIPSPHTVTYTEIKQACKSCLPDASVWHKTWP